ncbi:MAG: transcriptional regulator [Candidatus Deferrimicrobiaceae bacterium]
MGRSSARSASVGGNPPRMRRSPRRGLTPWRSRAVPGGNRSEKEVENHLEHIRKSLHPEGRQLDQVPAECRWCGFVFRKRDRLKAPSRCPVCKGEAISDPSFRVAGGQD